MANTTTDKDGNTVYTLQRPLKLSDGGRISAVAIRPLTFGDARFVQNLKNPSEAEMIVLLLARLADLAEPVVEKLDAADYVPLAEILDAELGKLAPSDGGKEKASESE